MRDLDDDMLLVAAGGIADGRSAAAAFALGADGVWVGTRLLASTESTAHSEYKRRVLAAGVSDTVRNTSPDRNSQTPPSAASATAR
ncbi:nitronate monooxygenase [Bradyrhizobium sp. S3.5.5]|uniref:nitronate monooxygenase n=1 Tax=Bradyrhizobium sp. S3.5.5 TaxID=3156430 RepID=UPI0033919BC4